MFRSEAYFSPDRLHRYWLIRQWDDRPLICFIALNPSVADEVINDHTVTKEIKFSQMWGFGGMLKLNLGAYRSTDSRAWRLSPDPFGPENTAEHLKSYIEQFKAVKVVAAWGKNGSYFPDRCKAIEETIQPLYCFGLNKDGTPVHPLMLPYTTQLRIYDASKARNATEANPEPEHSRRDTDGGAVKDSSQGIR